MNQQLYNDNRYKEEKRTYPEQDFQAAFIVYEDSLGDMYIDFNTYLKLCSYFLSRGLSMSNYFSYNETKFGYKEITRSQIEYIEKNSHQPNFKHTIRYENVYNKPSQMNTKSYDSSYNLENKSDPFYKDYVPDIFPSESFEIKPDDSSKKIEILNAFKGTRFEKKENYYRFNTPAKFEDAYEEFIEFIMKHTKGFSIIKHEKDDDDIILTFKKDSTNELYEMICVPNQGIKKLIEFRPVANDIESWINDSWFIEVTENSNGFKNDKLNVNGEELSYYFSHSELKDGELIYYDQTIFGGTDYKTFLRRTGGRGLYNPSKISVKPSELIISSLNKSQTDELLSILETKDYMDISGCIIDYINSHEVETKKIYSTKTDIIDKENKYQSFKLTDESGEYDCDMNLTVTEAFEDYIKNVYEKEQNRNTIKF